MTISSIRINDAQFGEAIDDLRSFVAIASVSFTKNPSYDKENLEKAALFASDKLIDLGFNVHSVRIDGSAPFVLAERITSVAKPTILLYAHYDVQPVTVDKWSSEPFTMIERDGRLYGRGASDDKGGIIAILTALRAYKEAGRELPVNIKILFEGEEEIGSPHLATLIKQQAERLRAEALVILDGMNRDVQTGTLTSSTRGFIGLQLKITALEKPVHSGIGCLLPDPALALADLVSTLADPMRIPGFMDGHKEMSQEERMAFRQASQSVDSYMRQNGIRPGAELLGDPEKSIYERIFETPTVSIVNFNSGEENGSYSIQSHASCTVNIRTLPGQDPDHIAKVVTDYIRSHPIKGHLALTIEQDGDNNWAWKADLSKRFTNDYLAALAENFFYATAMPSGGALPLLRDFSQLFPDMEMLIPAVEDPATAAHSHDESQDISVLRNSIDSLISFLDKAGR